MKKIIAGIISVGCCISIVSGFNVVAESEVIGRTVQNEDVKVNLSVYKNGRITITVYANRDLGLEQDITNIFTYDYKKIFQRHVSTSSFCSKSYNYDENGEKKTLSIKPTYNFFEGKQIISEEFQIEENYLDEVIVVTVLNTDIIIDLSDNSSKLSYFEETIQQLQDRIASLERENEILQVNKYDVNGDGWVDASDASYVLKYYAQISTGNLIEEI